jgi:hypothetical protein
MQPEELHRTLETLHRELSRSPQLDERTRMLLDQLVDDARRVGRSTDAVPASSPHGLDALAVGFEAEHPTLAAALRQFIDLLGKAGV